MLQEAMGVKSKSKAKPKSDRDAPKTDAQKAEALQDYRTAFLSRQASLLGRKEVLTGKAKFGIFGDGKELAQIALAKAFQPGDWRSGYYRDQTWLMALGVLNVRQFFAQLYADTDPSHEPSSMGRQMNNHPSTPMLDADGGWLNQIERYNTSSDISPTGGQMPRLLGLAYASKLYRNNPDLHGMSTYSLKGSEVAFGSIGNASTSEGHFYETMNAACVLQVPLVMSVWDDDYGISVPQKYHTVKESISKALAGFARDKDLPGLDIYVVNGWDYEALVKTYAQAVAKSRKDHSPCLVHVKELTQPQGHSTSGSHERYKSKERLDWEQSHDCLQLMRDWVLKASCIDATGLEALERECIEAVKAEKERAWSDFLEPLQAEKQALMETFDGLDLSASEDREALSSLQAELEAAPVLSRKLIAGIAFRAQLSLSPEARSRASALSAFIVNYQEQGKAVYRSHLHLERGRRALDIAEVAVRYADDAEMVDGRVVLRDFFHKKFAEDPRLFVIGEDIGFIGGVNQVFENVQKTFGDLRCTDTGIREATILGQGIGAAMRGLRPIVDIQYLDYLLYCFQTLSDDLASLHYRSGGQQLAPVIIRTKGHRLEGIWHSGSPIGMILGGIRGLHFCVPRNMTQAAGLYNTLLQSDEPALLIEVLSGYRIKEAMPENLGEFTVPLGQPEIMCSGDDLSIVTYGFNVRLAMEAAKFLQNIGISAEVIDVQTLLPFDRAHLIAASLRKTNAVIFFDEDVPGGASAFMMNEVLEKQGGFDHLELPPICLTAAPNRPSYGSDGDYYCKPNVEDLINAALRLMHERAPQRYPAPLY